MQLCIYLPVWRELKLDRIEFFVHSSILCIYLPVWRELKRIRLPAHFLRAPVFAYTFPFEGNWNSNRKFSSFGESIRFAYTFPFEGNWNSCFLFSKHLQHLHLCIYLPVWRELKLLETARYAYPAPALHIPSRLKGIETIDLCVALILIHLCIYLPVWRELKLAGLVRQIATLYFAYTFPFEGNWNHTRWLQPLSARGFAYTFPFEGNWNLLLRTDNE